MADDRIRLSQVVGVFGPGAMLDLPERSVLVQGLDEWEMFGSNTFKPIQEPRLAQLLHQRLEGDGRIAGGRPPELRTPPIDPNMPNRTPPGIKATIFPRWFVCEAVEGDTPNKRRLVPLQNLEVPARKVFKGEDGKKRRASPIRFVCGCVNGHLQDIEWKRILHAGRPSCNQAMWLLDSSTSADPRDTRVVCDCSASLSLEELFQRERLGRCFGERPWIGDRDPKGCTEQYLRLLIRSATNTYFPQVARIISLPQAEDELARRLDLLWAELSQCASIEEVGMARKFNPQVRANLEGYSDAEVFARISTMVSRRSGADQAEDPRIAEFETFASGRAIIGVNIPDARLHAETLPRGRWDPDLDGDPILKGIASLVAVHRLCEVSCLYGFTRFEPSPLASDELEDVGLAVSGAPLARNPEWLPAVEQYGEGFFFQLDPNALARWLAKSAVQARAGQLHAGLDAWAEARRAGGMPVSANVVKEYGRPEYLMAHSLAHALLMEVAIDCGYPASSLRERVYVLRRAPDEPISCGILIYTASAGNQGTLGGLVEVTRRFRNVLTSALERLRLCSGDPVCADHDPAMAVDDRALHGAACHGCLLISETSCEARNLFLDRALLIETVGTKSSGFFS